MEEFKNINNTEETAVNTATTSEEISSSNTDDSLIKYDTSDHDFLEELDLKLANQIVDDFMKAVDGRVTKKRQLSFARNVIKHMMVKFVESIFDDSSSDNQDKVSGIVMLKNMFMKYMTYAAKEDKDLYDDILTVAFDSFDIPDYNVMALSTDLPHESELWNRTPRILNNGTGVWGYPTVEDSNDYPESDDKTEEADDKANNTCDECCAFCEGCENKSEPNNDSDEEPATEKCIIPKITFALGNDAYGNPEVMFGENGELGPASRLGVSFDNADDANAAYEILSAFDKKLHDINGDSLISLMLESKIINLLDIYLTQHVYFICDNLHESDYEVKSKVMRDLADIIDAKIRSGKVISSIRRFKVDPNMPAEALNNPLYQTEIDTFKTFVDAFTKRYEKRVNKLEKKVKKLKKKLKGLSNK